MSGLLPGRLNRLLRSTDLPAANTRTSSGSPSATSVRTDEGTPETFTGDTPRSRIVWERSQDEVWPFRRGWRFGFLPSGRLPRISIGLFRSVRLCVTVHVHRAPSSL
jgi:hypothetical protein